MRHLTLLLTIFLGLFDLGTVQADTSFTNPSSGSGAGISSLGGQTGATQNFGNDTNVQMSSAGDTHTLTWAGVLAAARGGAGGLTGLVLGNGASAPTAYGGTNCTNQLLRALSATGGGTCITLTSAYVDSSVWTGTASSGLLKAASQGSLTAATPGTDYMTGSSTNTLTNKTLDCNGTGNSCLNFPGGGSTSWTHQAVTSSTSISGTHKFVTCDASGGPVVITLPLASATSGADFVIKKIDSSPNACTATRAGSDLIDGQNTAAITVQNNAISLEGDSAASAWRIY